MPLQLSLFHVTKRISQGKIASGYLLPLTFELVVHPLDAASRNGRAFGSTVTVTGKMCHGNQHLSAKRKRIDIQYRPGSFTGFDPITGNSSDVNTSETLLGGLPTPASGSLTVSMLRFENQFRLLSKQQATIELNSLLNSWYESLPLHSSIPTSITKSVKEMLQWVDSMQPDLQPNISSYQTLLDAFVKRVESMEVAEVILDRMLNALLRNHVDVKTCDETLVSQSSDTLLVTSVLYSFHKVMRIYGTNSNPLAAEQLLHRLEKICHEYCIPILANETYSIAITCWATNGKPREAEHILYSMMNLKDRTLRQSSITIMPTKADFDTCLNAWVKYPTKPSGQRAELLVLKMLELSEKGYDTKPNYKSYSKIVHAWVNSRHDHALARVDKIMETLERMDWSNETGKYNVKETVAQTYLAAMKACSYVVWNKSVIKKCLDYLSRLDKILGLQNVEWNTLQHIYAALIYTYAQSELPETETRVQEIFAEVDARHKQHVAGRMATKAGENEDFDPYLSITVYRALLHAFAKTGSGHKAEEVLKRVMHEYLDLMEKHVEIDPLRKIDTSCFNSVLLAWSRSTEPDAGLHAEKLFRQMCQSKSSNYMSVRLDVVSYNAVLSAMSGSTDVDVARRGDMYFKQILESSDPKCRASSVTYTKAISLWSNIGTKEALKRADEILNEMLTSKVSRIKPTKPAYKSYLDVLNKCSSVLSPEDYQNRFQEINQMMKSAGN
jgi:exonuclease VII small subunit